jgi:hypothetical protein
MSDTVVFENENNHGKEYFGFVSINTQSYTLQFIM